METAYAGEFVLLDPMQCVAHFVLEDWAEHVRPVTPGLICLSHGKQ